MKLFFTIFILLFSYLLFSQETTGVLNGRISSNHTISITSASITLYQNSTGLKYSTISQNDGFFSFNQLQPGQDYQLEINAFSHQPYKEENIQIQLGKITNITIVLISSTNTLNEVVLNGVRNSSKNGNEKKLKIDLITSLPTLNRSIQDATRLLTDSNLNSFGGANYRFNNLSIDGSATNDVLGFQEPSSGASGSLASGTPGGLAGTQPIGFGAISALSIKTAPFDVTLGNFTGASINAVTKYGTNKTTGSSYSFLRNKTLTGNYADGIKQPSVAFIDNQTGASIGGSIIKNKLFYFFNTEFAFRKEPVQNEPGSETSNISKLTVEQIANHLRTNYNYDPGATSNANLERKSGKLFLRFDYNLSENNKLTLRNNFVTGFTDNLEWSANVFNFGNQGYRHNSVTNTLAAELKSKINNAISNKLIVSNSIVNDNRTYNGRVFPHLEIIDNTANTIFAGTYREASIYGLTLNTTQITDNVTFIKNNHTVTFGSSTEINNIKYRFLTAYNGRWQYKSVSDFLNDKPNRVRGVYNVENNDFDYNKRTPSADYGVILSSIYLQDEFRISSKFNILAGIRIDSQFHPGDFPISQEFIKTPEFSNYKNDINVAPQLNPRIGFSYIFDKDNNYVLKGGSGLFTGRMPFVWYAYPEYISGTKYFNIDYKPTGVLPINENLNALEPLQSKRLTEINLVDNGFNLPRDWKSNLSFDIKFKNNYALNIDATYSKVLNGLLFKSINRKEDQKNNFIGTDNRPYYNTTSDAIKINSNFTNVFLLTNVKQGYRYNITFGLTKSETHYNGFLGYTYGISKDISSTVRNSHAANFEWNQALVANTPELTYSNFDLRHKFVSYHFYDINFKSSKLKFGLIYNGKSGSPFSFVYEGDVNRDGSAKNDILYIPRNQSEIKLQNIVDASNIVLVSANEQWNQLNNYINSDSYLSKNRGQYAERNAARTPWNHQVDAKIVFEKKIFKNKIEFSIDIFNLGNLLNRNWGAQHFVPNINNSGYALLDFVKIDGSQPVYQFNNPRGKPWQIDPVNSKWQAQFGVIFSF
ncbi:carboxypeptidase-like regulatory domain-containing protein [Flavobacterium sp.]|uniref:carboxypeptidase-like regulatory domain-containing protein n=1 Tax=Flavobacterium sp. TaxID=239 RepID=UPI00286E82DB|nr:carboxypeptidase-like regulatory domain-containing protein [Flavobacterium sp.]